MDDGRPLANQVFDQLFDEINTLKLAPGTKLSEVEVARRFGVSPQPVRDAFHRLRNIDLLLVQPQRATRVRGFSMTRINDARFVRLSVELEVLHRACEVWDDAKDALLQANLAAQKEAVKADDPDSMQSLDYAFHELICDQAGCPRTFQFIKQQKQKLDRLCVLEFDRRVRELETVYEDHLQIAQALKSRSTAKVQSAIRKHLSGLDETIEYIYSTHQEYFEAE